MSTEKVIEEVFSTFRDVLYRDFFYVVGGTCVIGAIFFAADKFDSLQNANAKTTAFVLVIGYVVGYAIQEFLSIANIVRTSYAPPGKLIRFFGNLFSPTDPWDSMPPAADVDAGELRQCVDLHMSSETRKRHHRTINLKQLCSSMGAAGLISAIIILIRAIKSDDLLIWYIFDGTFALSVILIIMNHIKAAQQRMLEFDVNDKCVTCSGSARKK